MSNGCKIALVDYNQGNITPVNLCPCSKSILRPTGHIRQYRIRIFLQYSRRLDLWARLHSRRAVSYPPFKLGKTDASTVLFSLNRRLLPFRLDDYHDSLSSITSQCPPKSPPMRRILFFFFKFLMW